MENDAAEIITDTRKFRLKRETRSFPAYFERCSFQPELETTNGRTGELKIEKTFTRFRRISLLRN